MKFLGICRKTKTKPEILKKFLEKVERLVPFNFFQKLFQNFGFVFKTKNLLNCQVYCKIY
ncbi:hypothetical protein CSB11_01935 [Candidatus Campbellbacteria bacterium]|nr:MAG: hypothetical protein CSB11_01935 [Candidatus Campbellbacteria bacterium]